jgi:erythritol kinase (D-erythritol 1-phosphate-forming)
MPQEVRITGGAAKSAALRLIFASVLDSSVRIVAREEAGAAGAAMIAAVQQGLYVDMMNCAKDWVDPYLDQTTLPNEKLTSIYDNAFQNYVETRKSMRPVWQRMSHVRPRGIA